MLEEILSEEEGHARYLGDHTWRKVSVKKLGVRDENQVFEKSKPESTDMLII